MREKESAPLPLGTTAQFPSQQRLCLFSCCGFVLLVHVMSGEVHILAVLLSSNMYISGTEDGLQPYHGPFANCPLPGLGVYKDRDLPQ